MGDYTEQVNRGAALLDEARPGWWREIDRDRLAMQSCHHCILGQLYDGYGRGLAQLPRLDVGSIRLGPTGYGFNVPRGANVADYAALADAWRALIRERAGAEGVPT